LLVYDEEFGFIRGDAERIHRRGRCLNLHRLATRDGYLGSAPKRHAPTLR
jgi:hypothetical protein